MGTPTLFYGLRLLEFEVVPGLELAIFEAGGCMFPD